MIDPDFDPLEDLHSCMFAIGHQQKIIDNLIEVNNALNKELRALNHLAKSNHKRLTLLEQYVNEIKSTPADRSRRP